MPEPITSPTTSGMPAPGSIFPDLYTSREGPADVTGILTRLRDSGSAGGVLPPSTVARSQELSVVPDAPSQAPAAVDERVAIEDLGVRQSGRPRNAQERIAQLTRRYHEKADETQELRAEIAELRGLVQSIPQQFAARAATQAAPVSAHDPIGALLNGGAGASPNAPTASPAAPSLLDVSRVVNEALDARDQRQRAQFDRSETIRQAHVQSFAEACEVVPALRDQRTQAWHTFEQLFHPNSPFRQLPDGPLHVALQVKGILADEIPRQATPQQRQQASLVTPAAAPVDLTGSQRGAVQKELEAAYAEMRGGDSTPGLHKRITGLKALLRSQT